MNMYAIGKKRTQAHMHTAKRCMIWDTPSLYPQGGNLTGKRTLKRLVKFSNK